MRTETIGSVGVGKSTLSSSLESYFLRRSPEPFWSFAYDGIEDNLPFQFFRERPGDFHLEKNAVFLINHASLIKSRQRDRQPLLCDFALVADLAYGDLGEDAYGGPGGAVLASIYDWLSHEIGPADCLIWLTCDLERQLERIRMRARDYETQGLAEDAMQFPYSAAYVTRLNELLEQRVAQHSRAIPVIRIDTSDKATSEWPDEWLEMIVGCIDRAISAGRSIDLRFPPS
ncbi:MAG: deoxynucleoside kinase [Allosphingosinicella sp.]